MSTDGAAPGRPPHAPSRAPTPEDAVRALLAGQAIGLPTETVYGLAADAGSQSAVQAIYRIKGRPADHPLIVHVHDTTQAGFWAELDARALKLAAALWPGPLTLILPRRAQAPAWACGGLRSIGLRCPAHPVAREVLQRAAQCGIRGLAAPSANRFGRISPTTAAHVRAEFGDTVPLVLDSGASQIGVESTIVDLSAPVPLLRRPGRVRADTLEALLGAPLAVPQPGAMHAVSGELASHYAPDAPLQLLSRSALRARLDGARLRGERVAAWVMGPLSEFDVSPTPAARSQCSVQILQMPGSPDEAERLLYATLRDMDRPGVAALLVQEPPADASWAAVHDRLGRAAADRRR